MTLRLLACFLPALLHPLGAAEFTAQWTGILDQSWESTANWDISQVPCNTQTDLFNAFLGVNAGAAVIDSTCTIKNLTVRSGAELLIGKERTLTLTGALLDGCVVSASPGGVATLSGGTHTCINGGRFLLHDETVLELSGLTVVNGRFKASDLDSDPTNNELRVVRLTTFSGGESDALIRVNDGTALTLTGNGFVNRGTILPSGDSGTAPLIISPPPFAPFLLSGPGEIRLEDYNDRILGPSFVIYTIRQAADHRIHGGGRISRLRIVNEGGFIANLPTVPLQISPHSPFENKGGLVKAENGATLRLTGSTFNSTNGGLYQIGDNSRFELDQASLTNLTISNDDADRNPLNHEVIVTTDSSFLNVVTEAAVSVKDGVTLNIGGLTNNGILQLGSAAAMSRVLIVSSSLSSGTPLSGNGVLRMDHPLDTITGTLSSFSFQPLLNHGPDHRIEGGGLINVDVVNQGTIVANLPEVPLRLDSFSTFKNDGGLVLAENGATIRFENSWFNSKNGGDFRLGDGSAFELDGVTFFDVTLSKADQDPDPGNHEVLVIKSSFLREVESEVPIVVQDGVTLTLGGPTFTNNGTVELESNSGISALHIEGSGINHELVIGGTGSILLDHLSDRITAAPSSGPDSMRHGPDHSIAGSGRVGMGRIRITNEGTLEANRQGEQLTVDAYGPATMNYGVLRASAGGILGISESIEDTGGHVEVESGSQLLVSGTMKQTNGSTLAHGWIESTGFAFKAATVRGRGTFNGPLTADFSSVEPGNSTGTLTVRGNTTLANGTSLCIEIASASDHDLLSVTPGTCQLNGATLRLDLLGDATNLSGSDTLTIVSSPGGVTGAFLNASDGDRLHTVDGLTSFVVRYSANSVTLTDFARGLSGIANRAPVFVSPVGDAAVGENAASATLVAAFHAYDPEGAIVQYSIADPSVPFAMDPRTGELKVNASLDRETQSNYLLTLRASDGVHSSEIFLVVRLTDLVDTNEEIVESLLTSPSGAFPEENDPALIGFDADPDSDGRSNAFELWRGTNPAVADQPSPLLLEPYQRFTSPPFPLIPMIGSSASVVVEVDPAVDDRLSMDAFFSFDLTQWRIATVNRMVLSDDGSVRRIRFYDSTIGSRPVRFFFQFKFDPDI